MSSPNAFVVKFLSLAHLVQGYRTTLATVGILATGRSWITVPPQAAGTAYPLRYQQLIEKQISINPVAPGPS